MFIANSSSVVVKVVVLVEDVVSVVRRPGEALRSLPSLNFNKFLFPQ